MTQKHYRFKREPYSLEVLAELPPEGKKLWLDLEEQELPDHLRMIGITEDDHTEGLLEHLSTMIYNFGELFYRPDNGRIFVP